MVDDCIPAPTDQNNSPIDANTVEGQLAAVQSAIEAVEQRGQEFWIKDRKLRRADAKVLYDERRRLLQEASRANSGGIRVQRIVPL